MSVIPRMPPFAGAHDNSFRISYLLLLILLSTWYIIVYDGSIYEIMRRSTPRRGARYHSTPINIDSYNSFYELIKHPFVGEKSARVLLGLVRAGRSCCLKLLSASQNILHCRKTSTRTIRRTYCECTHTHARQRQRLY